MPITKGQSTVTLDCLYLLFKLYGEREVALRPGVLNRSERAGPLTASLVNRRQLQPPHCPRVDNRGVALGTAIHGGFVWHRGTTITTPITITSGGTTGGAVPAPTAPHSAEE